MKLKKITFETAVELTDAHSEEYRKTYIKGYNRAVGDLKRLKKAKRVKVSRVDEGTCSMSEIYKLAEQIDRLDKVYANVSVTASKRTDQLVQHIEGVNHVINELKSRFEKCETYNIDAEIKKIHAVVQAHDTIQGEDDDRLNKLESQIAVIHAGDTDIQKRMIQSIYDLNEKVKKLEE